MFYYLHSLTYEEVREVPYIRSLRGLTYAESMQRIRKVYKCLPFGNVAGRWLFSARGCTVPAGCSLLLPALQVSSIMSRLSSSGLVHGESGHVFLQAVYLCRLLYAPYQVHKRRGPSLASQTYFRERMRAKRKYVWLARLERPQTHAFLGQLLGHRENGKRSYNRG